MVSGAAAQVAAPAAATHKHYESAPQASQPGPNGELAPRLQNLGTHTFPVSTTKPAVQRFVNQGLNLAYAFNHAEARRAFREAARLDPNLAIAYWGQALVLGPNINAVMEPNEEPHAYELIQKAQSLKGKATPRERALIDALAKRYSGSADHRTANDKAYADAMRAVHKQFPADLDIAMLYVESMMDLRPWGYWMPDGRPHEGTVEIVALTEDVLRRNPKHPGALHMLIHLVEPTTTPERAEKAADALMPLMPAAGHMVHMASHIYQRVGRYADAMKSNQLAIAADEDYITPVPGAGAVSDGLLPAQHPLPVVRRHRRRAVGGRHRRGQEGRGEDPRHGAGRDAADRRLPRDALLGQRAVRPLGRDPQGAGAAVHQRVPDRGVALRARHGPGGHRQGRRGREGTGDADADAGAPVARQPELLAQHRPRHHEHRAGGARRRDRRRQGRVRQGRRPASSSRCGSKTRWSTPSRRSGPSRLGTRSARCCSKPAGRPRPRPSTGRT